ncbi:DUF4832 domain-containing protein [Modestobacter sp. Leaf380]|uniref:DUF4832 domain-containing protein n=1 Tax=Modestobacter sp. Leaf380 TaxID=1736356 RepID=UPI0006F2454E|nr:DUF4832 domain-containing protein [Modestobacter sp. Leaf380]KQS68821.1 hypothetical protein ASG41_07910 [Modestobacter sp. Leaf380]
MPVVAALSAAVTLAVVAVGAPLLWPRPLTGLLARRAAHVVPRVVLVVCSLCLVLQVASWPGADGASVGARATDTTTATDLPVAEPPGVPVPAGRPGSAGDPSGPGATALPAPAAGALTQVDDVPSANDAGARDPAAPADPAGPVTGDPADPAAPTAAAEESPGVAVPVVPTTDEQPGPNVVTHVTQLTETSALLANPGMGYQGWTATSGALPQSTDYRRGEHPQQGGFDWESLNPSRGVYDWRPVDTLLSQATAAGRQASFRVYTMSGAPYGVNRVPAWVEAAGAIIRPTADLEPDYRSGVYQAEWGRFVDAMAARYDGDPRIAFIDISGYGLFNEWQANPYTDLADAVGQNDSIDSSTRRHLVQVFTGGSGTARVLAPDGRTETTLAYSHRGFQRTQLLMPYGGMWSSTRYVLINHPQVGFRNDALFGPDATLSLLSRIGYGITDLWKRAPVLFEAIGPPPAGTMAEAAATMRGLGASYFHENAVVFDRAALTELVRPLGYRYVCRTVEAPVVVTTATPLTVRTDWTNSGTARAYPRTGQVFDVTYALARADGTVVHTWAQGEAVSEWLPGEQHQLTTSTVLPDLPRGSYQLMVGVRQASDGDRIQLPLTTSRTDGWYPVSSVSVV